MTRRRSGKSRDNPKEKRASKAERQMLTWGWFAALTSTAAASQDKEATKDYVFVPIIQDVAISFVTMAIVYLAFTRGVPDRFGLTHTIWWYPFVFILLYYAWMSSWQLAWSADARWTSTTEDSMIFIRLYISAQLLAIPIEMIHDGPLIDKMPMVAHHLISVTGYFYGLINKRAHFFCAAAGLSEMSTVFLEGVLLANRKDHIGAFFPSWYLPLNGALLWLSYIIFRLFLFPGLLAIYAYDILYAPPGAVPFYDKLLVRFALPAPLFILFLLSVMWFSRIHRGFVSKVLNRGPKKNV